MCKFQTFSIAKLSSKYEGIKELSQSEISTTNISKLYLILESVKRDFKAKEFHLNWTPKEIYVTFKYL